MRSKTLGVLLAVSGYAWAGGYGKMSLSFEANQGQTDARVQFLSRGSGQTLFLTSTEAVLRSGHDVFRMKLKGANAASKGEGAELRAGKSNYFIGSDPAKWRTGVAQYGRVRFAEVYPGIDLVYYGADGKLEYDWMVKPGADASKIRLQFEGVQKMRVDSNGDLVLKTASGEIREKKPLVYQERREGIAGRYAIRGREARFEIGSYDRGKQLVIDPVLAYTSYLGGSSNDWGTGIAADAAGNTYVTGLTESADFPLSHAFQSSNPPSTDESETSDDAFVSKISADGSTLIYSTFIGGTGSDSANAIAVDAAGDAYITGATQSADFPLSNAFQSKNLGAFVNSFVTKLNPSGSALIFSTYLGGDQSDTGLGIAVDAAGNAYIAGNTNSDNFPLVNPIEDIKPGDVFPSAFLTKMSANGSTLIYSTYLGGYKGEDFAYGVAVDSTGSAYVGGTTAASDLPIVNGLQSASKNSSNTGFVMKINPAGSALVYSTYLGGSVVDHLYAIAVDSSGNAYVTGSTNSKDFPTVNALQGSGGPSAFVSKINATGSALVWSTYLGGGGSAGYGIAVNSLGQAWVTGTMSPTNFPIVNPLFSTNDGAIFGSQFSADGGSLVFSSPLWIGTELQGGIAVDASGAVYVTGEVSINDTSTATGFQPNFGGGQEDAYVLKIAGGPVAPSIAGVSNGASFQPGIVPGSWATIQGSNLSSKTDTWDSFIVNGKLPTTVDGVSVTVGGQNAYVYYISPGQINFIVPEVPAGPQEVVVKNSSGSSPAVSANVDTFGPAFFPWPDNQVVATTQSFSLAAKSGTFAGLTTTPAKPGQTIILWGTGFGPTNPSLGQGEETPGNATYSTETLPLVTINDVSATVYGAALAPGFAGLYQVAIQVPASLGNGDWPVVATIGGVSSPSSMVLTVQQ
jgi:uncharacterized protein (TIGR03437 family)